MVDLASVAATAATAGAVAADPGNRVSPSAAEEAARVALAGREALQARRFGELPGLLAAEQQSWRNCLGALSEAFEALAAVSGAAGGVAIPCGRAPMSLALVWASPGERGPGPRESLQAALKGAGYRTFPCRVDLRGLELEEG